MPHSTVDRAKPVPLYHQLEELLQERIELGEWSSGSRIPTERQLAAQYGVSQITVRQALARLAREGLVKRCQGRGTFVSQPSVIQDLLHLAGFSAGFARAGVDIQTRLEGVGVVVASEGVAKRLSMGVGEPVIKIGRVRSSAGVPICLQTSYLPYALCRPLLDHNLEHESLFELLTEACSLEFARAEEIVSAVPVDEYEGKMLGVAAGSPALLVRRITFDRKGRPVEFVKSVLRGDRCKFTVTLSAEVKRNDASVERQRVGLETQVS